MYCVNRESQTISMRIEKPRKMKYGFLNLRRLLSMKSSRNKLRTRLRRRTPFNIAPIDPTIEHPICNIQEINARKFETKIKQELRILVTVNYLDVDENYGGALNPIQVIDPPE